MKLSILISVLLHAGVLTALAWVDAAPPRAPSLAGGSGGSGGRGPGRDRGPETFTVGIRRPEIDREPSRAEPAPSLAEYLESGLREAPATFQTEIAPRPASNLEEGRDPDADLAAAEARIEPSPPAIPEVKEVKEVKIAAKESPAEASRAAEAAPKETAASAGEQGNGDGRGPPGAVAPSTDDPNVLRPAYPASCERKRHQGTVILRIHLSAEGLPERIELLQSAGCPDLDRAAIQAVEKARFHPAREWGRAVASVIDQPFRFHF